MVITNGFYHKGSQGEMAQLLALDPDDFDQTFLESNLTLWTNLSSTTGWTSIDAVGICNIYYRLVDDVSLEYGWKI